MASHPGAWSWVLCLSLLLVAFGVVSAQTTSSNAPSLSDVYGRQLGDQLKKLFPYCVANGQQDQQDTFGFDAMDPSPRVCRATRYKTTVINRLDGPPLITPPTTPSKTAGRLCTKAELAIYFSTIDGKVASSRNCDPNNLQNYLAGCSPGYASWTTNARFQIDDEGEPARDDLLPITNNAGLDAAGLEAIACCDGFFCPENLACMIPCPKGAFCPKSRNPSSDGSARGRPFCVPYPYQAIQWSTNDPPTAALTCGGASTWNAATGAKQGDGIFCDAGAYCPYASGRFNDTSSIQCPSGYYCRKGTTVAKKCSGLASCPAGDSQQDLKGAGIGFVVFLLIVLAITYYLVDYITNARLEQVEKRRMRSEQHARSRQLARERWHRAGRKIIDTIRKKNKELGITRPSTAGSRPGSSYGYPPAQPSNDLYGNGSNLYGAPPVAGVGSDLYGAPPEAASAAGDLYGAPAGGDLYGAVPAPAVEMTKRNKKVNYEDVYEELARQNKARSPEETLFDTILNSEGPMAGRKIRVQLELEFRDVNLFLKSNGRKLLDNISGILKPGRVTAVMGPSGAGKSMFLTAVAGKETYCNMTGEVLINGQAGNIQAYKRIIGFVPQDDIVHGNLTVEENLWFSANYRLPRGMSKRNKVLIVERTLISLGIDHIRHSRVGTVEQRGISGGQRKRVNVGLEMVIDPSLLILDEPTSGLDSTSSFKVLQALRQEALRGVNIGVVLHQPSYKLFHMFHDVMFLMPGGKVVYLGPVRQAEEYFASLGFPIPDRVNPPDHYMDVLAGEVPSTLENFDIKRLPELWLETQGRPRRSESGLGQVEIPIRDDVSILHPGTGKHNKMNPIVAAESFGNKLLQDVSAKWKQNFEDFADIFRKQENRSGRVTPGFGRQFLTIYSRLCKQQFRSMRVLFQDYVILLITGAALGLLTPTDDSKLGGPTAYTNTIIAVSLLAMIAGLRTFNLDTLNFYRESASGINKLAYFLAKDLSDWPHIFLKPIFYMALFYFFNDPRSTFVSNVGVTICLVYCVTGVSYVLATLMPPSSSQLAAAVVTLIASVIAGKGNSGGIVKVFYALSFARWALEAYVLANARRYSGVWLLTRCGALQKANYDISDYGLCIFMLLFFGVLARWGAFMLLIGLHRDKQK